jgi:hypothetical protein
VATESEPAAESEAAAGVEPEAEPVAAAEVAADGGELQAGAGGKGVQAAPLEPPVPAPDPDDHGGYVETSTNPVAAAAGLHSKTGESHRMLVDADGNQLDPEELFEDPGPRSTVVYWRRKVSEVFLPEGANTPTRRVFATAGTAIARDEAERIRRVYALPEQVPMSQTRPR